MRLTKGTKECIVNNTVNATMKALRAKLRAEENELAVIVYDAVYPADVQKAMNKLPDTFFSSASCMYADIGGKNRAVVYLLSSKKISAQDSHGYQLPRLEAAEMSDDVKARFAGHEAERKSADTRQRELFAQVKSMVEGISTTEKLAKEWPEGLDFYKEYLDAPARNPLTVSAASINAMIECIVNDDAVLVQAEM